MKTMLAMMTVALSVMAFCASADAGQIWTDGNGDGLPDAGSPPNPQVPSTNVTVGIWIDAQSFSWTNFLAYVEWSGDCISYVSASYVISGGSNFQIDDFSHPRGVGFGGSGYTQGGVDHIGNVTLHINSPIPCCVTPIIDVYNPYYVFSQLGAGSAYMLFVTNPGTCFNGFGEQFGACCLPDFSCIPNINAIQCAAAGGQWLENQPCSSCPDGGPPREACCFPDCSCVEAPVGQCPPGSVPLGAGTNCSPNPCSCPPLLEACCFPDGSCIDALVGQCPAGSVPQGIGTSCATTTCPPVPTGGCCFPNFTCLDGLTEAQCFGAGGLIWFEGATCDQLPICTEPDAVESKSWGGIKGLYR